MPSDITLVSVYPPAGRRHAGRSGVASYTANLAHSLADAGPHVSVIAPLEPGLAEWSSDRGVHVSRPFERGPSALWFAARAARSAGSQLVHIQFETFLYGGSATLVGLPPALWSLRRAGQRVVVTLHQVVEPSGVDGSFVRLHRVRSPSYVARAGVASLQRTIRWLADAVVVHEPSFTSIVPGSCVIPHGVESLVAPERASARAELGLGSKPVVLCFGFVAPYKGLEKALEAAHLSLGRFQVVVAGGDHPRLAGRDDYAAQLGSRWRAAARFTGYVSEEDVPRWFAAADLALYPYPKPFSSSGALALALGYGTPVLISPELGTCIGADADLVVPTEPRALANALVQILDNPHRLDRVRRASRALAHGRSWRDVARQHLELYGEVLDADRALGRRVRTN